jgi:hypothetical protein
MIRDYTYQEIKDLNTVDGLQVWHVRETVVRRGNTAVAKVLDANGGFLCLVVLHDLKGQQGEGAYSGAELKKLPNDHKLALEAISNDAEESYSHDDLFVVIKKAVEKEGKDWNYDGWKKVVSQLTFNQCWIFDKTTATYRIDYETIEEILRKGEFRNE